MAKIIIEINQSEPVNVSGLGIGIEMQASIRVEGTHSYDDAIANSVCKKLAEVYNATLQDGVKQAVKLTFDEITKAGEENDH